MHNIIVRAKPNLIRRHVQVITKQNVSVIVNPTKTTNLRELKKPAPQPAPIPQKATPAKPPISAVSRRQFIKERKVKKTTVRHITADPQPESIPRIGSIRNIGRGKILVIIGNGPSILEADLGKLVDNPTIDILSINKPDHRVWPTKYWAFFDHSQFVRHEDLWNSYEGTIFNSTAIKRQKTKSMQFKNISGKGWSRDLMNDGICIGRSSVFASMQIAMWMNYEHVYMFGVDMNPDGIDGKLHFYGVNPDVDPAIRRSRFVKEAEFYDIAAGLMTQTERARFTFCSSYNHHNFVNKYNKLDHKLAIDLILDHSKKMA